MAEVSNDTFDHLDEGNKLVHSFDLLFHITFIKKSYFHIYFLSIRFQYNYN